MTSPRAIAFGYDGSPLAELALGWAAETARRSSARLEVVVATIPYGEPAWVVVDETYRDRMQEIAVQAEKALAAPEAQGAKVAQHGGEPPSVMTKASETADLVVVGALGHSRLEAGLLGAVSRHLAAHAHCSVVIVRPAASGGNPRIVVGVEAGESSAAVLRFAMERADAAQAPVVAIHGWKPGRALDLEARLAAGLGDDADHAERLLAELTAGLAAEFPGADLTTEAAPMSHERYLVDASENAALVVVGSRGRSAFKRLLLGSVSQDVLQHAKCPVAVVR